MKIRELFNRKTILYVLLDVFLINAAAFFALFVRFEFSFSFMQNGYWDVIRAVWAPGTLVCIVSFACFHVYSSMWRFASFKELMETGVASVIGSAFYMMVVFVMKKTLPRRFFFFPVFYGSGSLLPYQKIFPYRQLGLFFSQHIRMVVTVL